MSSFMIQLALLASIGISQVVVAQRCQFLDPDSNPRQHLLIHSQAEITSLFQSCTEIVDDILIDQNYTGDAIDFPGITNISAKLSFQSPVLRNIAFSDLTTIRDLRMDLREPSTSISAPKLTKAGTVAIYGLGDVDFDLPALTNLSSLILNAAVTNFNIPLLQKADAIRLQIRALFSGPEIPFLDVSLPVLESIGSLQISGYYKSLALPKLSSVEISRRGNETAKGSLDIQPVNAINISLPSLTIAEYVKISYNSSISLPLLRKAGLISLTAIETSAIMLPALESALKIIVSGDFTSISFPSLREAWMFGENYDQYKYPLCELIKADWTRVEEHMSSSGSGACYDLANKNAYPEICNNARSNNCYVPPPAYTPLPSPPENKSLSDEQKIALAVGLGVGGIALMCVVVYFWVAKLNERKEKMDFEPKEQTDGLELDGVTIVSEARDSKEVVISTTMPVESNVEPETAR